MDPWRIFEQKLEAEDDKAVEWLQKSEHKLEFEDNFEPPKSDRLPDSDEYLALLGLLKKKHSFPFSHEQFFFCSEAKLEKIRSDPNFLRQLAQKREDCMQALLNSDNLSEEIINLDTPVENSAILRTILPQRQALTQGELFELVQYDQLINESDISNQNTENSHSR